MKWNALSKTNILLGLAALLAVSTHSCITEYSPQTVNEVSNFLVVEGIITAPITRIKLSRSIGISDNINSILKVSDANVYIEYNEGTIQGTYDASTDRYNIPTGSLNPAYEYRLCIEIGQDKYESEYLTPVVTTATVDSIFLSKENRGAPVELYITTHDDTPDASRFYQWQYEEDWEIQAALYANAGFEHGNRTDSIIVYDLNTPNNTFYCWSNNYAGKTSIASSNKLEKNIIAKKKLYEVNPSERRFFTLYRVRVRQNQIRKSAYAYFEKLRENTEQTGGLFAPMPIELRGNIRCVTDPNQPTVGYIDVSTTVMTERYYEYMELSNFYEPDNNISCDLELDVFYRYFFGAQILYYFPEEDIVYSYTKPICVDCRLLRGTKNRPPDWPNNHY